MRELDRLDFPDWLAIDRLLARFVGVPHERVDEAIPSIEELYLTDAGTYGTIAQVQTLEPTVRVSAGVTLSVVDYINATGYCLSAVQVTSGVVWYYDSLAGGLQPKGSSGCPAVTGGTPGDSVSG